MNEDAEKSKKGFAGLSGMVSHVDVSEIGPISEPQKSMTPSSEPTRNPSRGQSFQVDDTLLRQPTPKAFWSQPWFKWTAGIGIFLIIVAALTDDDKPQPSPYSSPSTGQYTYTPAPQVAAPTEELPPVGSGLVLSSNQVRYCLAQAIRLESWSANVNQYSDMSVDMFNLAVGEYNSRCANYRYKSSIMSGVRSEVESRRAQLAYEGLLKANMYR